MGGMNKSTVLRRQRVGQRLVWDRLSAGLSDYQMAVIFASIASGEPVVIQFLLHLLTSCDPHLWPKRPF